MACSVSTSTLATPPTSNPPAPTPTEAIPSLVPNVIGSDDAAADLREAVGYGVAGGHGETAGLHRAREALEKRLVVFDDQERAVGLIGQFGDGVHGSGILMADTVRYGVAMPFCQGRIKPVKAAH